MLNKETVSVLLAVALMGVSAPAFSQIQIPDAVAGPGETEIARFHAEGAQVYECKADATGALVWQFREPVASLILDGKTMGRHYAGPTWELADGSAVTGKVEGKVPGASAKDVPWLKLSVTSARGNGQLSGAATVQRIETKGGVASGPCEKAGDFLSVAYSAQYRFLKK